MLTIGPHLRPLQLGGGLSHGAGIGARMGGLFLQRCSLLARTYLRTASTLQGLQTLDPFTDMYTYTGMCLAHPLDIVNTF